MSPVGFVLNETCHRGLLSVCKRCPGRLRWLPAREFQPRDGQRNSNEEDDRLAAGRLYGRKDRRGLEQSPRPRGLIYRRAEYCSGTTARFANNRWLERLAHRL